MSKQRIVIKIGSNVINANTERIGRWVLESLAGQIAELWKQGSEMVIVTSGAVSSGKEILDLESMTDKLLRRQMLASLGQARLMRLYSDLFAKFGIHVAQILLVRSDFLNREHFMNFQKAVSSLLEHRVIPIINENDAIAVEERAFLDNDQLAALSAVAVDANRLVLLTNVDGLYTAHPVHDASATLVRHVKDGGKELERMCSRDTSSHGLGGMLAKVRAARLAARNNIEVIITNGLKIGAIADVTSGTYIGTTFAPIKNKKGDREKWLLLGASAKGKIEVDDGAAAALKKGKSLLAVGVTHVSGEFSPKDIVEIIDANGETLACGIVNYGKHELVQAVELHGKQSGEKMKSLFDREVVHVDNLTLL